MDAATKKFYIENGYVVFKNVVPLDYIHSLYQTVVSVLNKHRRKLPPFSNTLLWNDPLFHEAMFHFREEQPQAFGYLFDTIQTSTGLWRLGTDKKLCEIAAELMDDLDHGLSITDLLLRMDAPQDTRNKLEWHQDSSYFRQNDLGCNGCVCSMPMLTLALDHGPLEILPKSHSVGRIEVESTGKNDAITSEQYRVPLEIVQRFEPKKIIIEAGDAIFFNFDLIHRSGYNASRFFRFTAITRYHRLLANDFKAGRLIYRTRPSDVAVANSIEG